MFESLRCLLRRWLRYWRYERHDLYVSEARFKEFLRDGR